MEPDTLMEAVRYFADLEICDLYMRRIKWPDGHVACPFCGSERIGEIKSRHLLRCKDCRRDIRLRSGTIFEDSPLPLGVWFVAIWAVANNVRITSTGLATAVGITQKSAWFVLRRVYTAIVLAT
jgi:transposase-like protein